VSTAPDLRAEEVLQARLTAIGSKANSLGGEPFESELLLYKDDDVESGIWEVTPGIFPGRKDGCWEYMHFVTGAGTITDESGHVIEIRPGVAAFAPDGWRGTWNVTSTVRKTFVIGKTRRKDDG
jgi:uncharacterized protein